MKKVIILLLIFIVKTSAAQTIKFNLFSFDPCTKENEHELLYEISSSEGTFKIQDTIGTIILPRTGIYFIKLWAPEFFSTPNDTIRLEITEHRHYYDTVVLNKIIQYVTPGHPNSNSDQPSSGFNCCDNLCEGRNTDYYQNGNKRMEGKFKKGQPIGDLYYFNSDGSIKEIQSYAKSGNGRVFRIQYFDNGIRTKVRSIVN